MNTLDCITKIIWPISRTDGSEAKIIASVMFGSGLTPSYDVFVLHRERATTEWQLCSKKPAQGWLEMSVDEYTQHGRSDMLKVVTPAEILSAMKWLGKPISEFNAYINQLNN